MWDWNSGESVHAWRFWLFIASAFFLLLAVISSVVAEAVFGRRETQLVNEQITNLEKEIEKRPPHRSLTTGQTAKLIELLAPHRDLYPRVELVPIMGVPDAHGYAKDFEKVLRRAGWGNVEIKDLQERMRIVGLKIFSYGPQDTPNAGQIFQDALEQVGIASEIRFSVNELHGFAFHIGEKK